MSEDEKYRISLINDLIALVNKGNSGFRYIVPSYLMSRDYCKLRMWKVTGKKYSIIEIGNEVRVFTQVWKHPVFEVADEVIYQLKDKPHYKDIIEIANILGGKNV